MWTKVALAALVFGIASSGPRVRRDKADEVDVPPSGDRVSRFRGGNTKTPGIPLPRRLAGVNLRRGHADVSLRGGQAEIRPRGGQAEIRPRGGQAEIRPRGGQAEIRPRGGQAKTRPRGGQAKIRPRGGRADVSLRRGQDDLSIRGGHADVSLRRGHAGVSLRRGHAGVSLRRGHADVSLTKGQDDLSISGGRQPITLNESQAGVALSQGASATSSSTLSSSSGSLENINSFESTTESESRDHSNTSAQFSFQGVSATPNVSSSSVAIKFGAEDSVSFGTNGFGETSSSPTSTSAGGSHRFSSRGGHSKSRFTITDLPTSFSSKNLKDGTASERGVGPATFFKESSGSVSTLASMVEPTEFGSEGSGTLSVPSASGKESSPAVSLKVATGSAGSNRLKGHFIRGKKASSVLADSSATNSDGIGTLLDGGSSAAQTKATHGRSTATSAPASDGSFGGFSFKGLRGVSATSQGSVSERLSVESSSVSPTSAGTDRVGRLSVGDFIAGSTSENSGDTDKISTTGSSATSISVHKSGSNKFSAEGSDIISASNNQEKVEDVSNTRSSVASTSIANDGLRISSGDSQAVANSRGRISNRDSQTVTNSRGRISNRDSQAVTNSRGRTSNRGSQAVTNSRGRISNRDSQAFTNSRGRTSNRGSQAVTNSRRRISNRDLQAVATVRGNGGRAFIDTESDAASTLLGKRQLSSHTFRKLGTISVSTDSGKPNRLSVKDSGLSNSRGKSFGSFSTSSSSSRSGAEEVLKNNDDSATVIGDALKRIPAVLSASTESTAVGSFPVRSTAASVDESAGFFKRGPGTTTTFSNDLPPGGLSIGSSSSETTLEGSSQGSPDTQIFITHTDAVDGNNKNSDIAGGLLFKGLRDATATSQGSVSERLSSTGIIQKPSVDDFSADSKSANSGEIGKISVRHSSPTSASDHNSDSGKFSIRGSDVISGSANQERIIDLSTGSNLASTSTVSDGLRFPNAGLHAADTSTGIDGISFTNIQTDASQASLGNEGLGSFSLGRLGTATAVSNTGKLNRLSARGSGISEGFRGLPAGSSGQSLEPAGGGSVEISARESTAAFPIGDRSLGRFSALSSRSTSGTESDLKNNLAFNSVAGDASKGSTNVGSFSTQRSTAASGGHDGDFSKRGPGVRAPFNSDLSLKASSVGSPISPSSVEGSSNGSPNIPIVITHSDAFDGNSKNSASSNAGGRKPNFSAHLEGPFSVSKDIDIGSTTATILNAGFTSTGELALENAIGLGENGEARPTALSNSFIDATIEHARQGLSGTSGSGLFLSAAAESSFNHRSPGLIDESNNDSKFAQSGLETHGRTRFEENQGVSKISSTGTNASKGASAVPSVSTGLEGKNQFKNQATKILDSSQPTTKATGITRPKSNLLPSRQSSRSGVVNNQNGDASTTSHSSGASSKGSSTVSDSKTFSHRTLTSQVSVRSLIGQPVLAPIKSALSSTSTSSATASTADASQAVATTGIEKSKAQEVTPQSFSSSTSLSSSSRSSLSVNTVPHFGGTSTTDLSKISASRSFSSPAEATEVSNTVTSESASFNRRIGTAGTTIQSESNTPVSHFTTSLNSAASKQSGSSTSSFISTDEKVSQPTIAGQPVRGAFSSASTLTGTSTDASSSTQASFGSESKALSRVNFASIRDSPTAAVPGSTSTATSSTAILAPQKIDQPALVPIAIASASTSTRDSTASAPTASLSSGDATTVRGRTRVPIRTAQSSVSSSSIGSSQSSTVPHFGGAFPSDLPKSSPSSSSSVTIARDASNSIKSNPFPTPSALTVTGTTSTLPFESTFSGGSDAEATLVPERGVPASHSSVSSTIPSSSPINTGSHSSNFSTTDSLKTSVSSASSFSSEIQRVLQLVNLGQPAFIPAASTLISNRDKPNETAQSSFSKATSTGSSQSINVIPNFSSTSSSGLSKTSNSNSILSPTSNPVTVTQFPSVSVLSSTGASSKVSSSGSKLSSKVSGTASTTLVPEERVPASSTFVFSQPPGTSSKALTSSASSGISKDKKVLQLPISHPVHIPLVSTLTSKEASTTSSSARASERAGSTHKNALSRIGFVSNGDLSVTPASSSSSSTTANKKIAPKAVGQSTKVPVTSSTASSSAGSTSSRNTILQSVSTSAEDSPTSLSSAASSSSKTERGSASATEVQPVKVIASSAFTSKAESSRVSSSSGASSATSSSAGTSTSTNARDPGNSVDSSVHESSISLSDRQAHIGNVANFVTAGGARFFGTGHPSSIPTVAIPIATSGALVEPRLGSGVTFGSNTPVFLANAVQASTPVVHSIPTTFLTGGQSNHAFVHGQNLALSSPLSFFSVPSHQIIGIDAAQG